MAARRRQCAAMQEYERLFEEQVSFRTNQQRAEEFTARALTSQCETLQGPSPACGPR